MWRAGRRAAALAAVVLSLPVPLGGQADASGDGAPLPVLDVPFVAQTEALCGAAAASMAFRYWGERGIGVEDLAHLLTPDGRGILTERLVAEVRRRGWRALAVGGGRSELGRQVARGRPVIALIEVAPDRYHYVVVVASWAGGTAYHDPARAPWRVASAASFDGAWERAGRWAVAVLPGSGGRRASAASAAPSTHPPTPHSTRSSGCRGAVGAAVELARSGRLEEAGALLEGAVAACPGAAAPRRELAGVRLRQDRPGDAERWAEEAVRRDPEDAHALRTLATARYLGGDEAGALAAWARAGHSSLDLVRISGLGRTRHSPVAELIGLEAGHALTPARLGTARRRLASLPAAAATRLDYRPVGGGTVEVRASVLERPLAPASPLGLTALALRAAATGELAVTAAGPTGAGETWRLVWRPSSVRPRLRLGVALPAHLGFPGVWRLSGSWERERWEIPSAEAAADLRSHGEGTRRRLAAGVESWATAWLRWGGGLAVERWSGEGVRLALSGELETRAAADRLSARLGLEGWRGVAGPGATTRLEAELRWRSRVERRGTVVDLRTDLALVSAAAPRFLWPGASAGEARPVPLRAHPLLREGSVAGPAFGPRLAATGIEVTRWLRIPGLPSEAPPRLGLSGFVDAAGAWGPDGPRPLLTDVGLGLRIAPGEAGRFRLDVARGIMDDAAAFSVGWQTAWPGR